MEHSKHLERAKQDGDLDTVCFADVRPGEIQPWYDWALRDKDVITPKYRRWIFERDGYRCRYCFRREAHMTVDHWFPRACGGTNKPTNLMTSCMTCNLKKGRYRIRWRPKLYWHLERCEAE